jgi:hypothetical protein
LRNTTPCEGEERKKERKKKKEKKNVGPDRI